MWTKKTLGLILVAATLGVAFQNCSDFHALSLRASSQSTSRLHAFAGGRTAMYTEGGLVSAVGDIETVYSHSDSACSQEDIPDTPAHAFRTADGRVNLTVSHFPGNYRSIGPDLNSVQHVCRPSYASAGETNNKLAKYHEWIAAPYTVDGSYIIALVHNEWYPKLINPKCTGGWVNSITMALSYDGGVSYSHQGDYKVRMPAVPWDNSFDCEAGSPNESVYGSFLPTGIFDGHDGYLYSYFVVWADPQGVGNTGTCLMRSNTIDQAKGWTVWTGTDWQPSLTTPRCQPINFSPLGTMPGWLSVKYSTFFNKFIALLDSGDQNDLRLYFALSDDLKNWSEAKPFGHNVIAPGGSSQYWSLLDPTDTSRNFDNVGQDPYIYFTVFNDNNYDRDLVRQKIHFEGPASSRAPASTTLEVGSVPAGYPFSCDQLNPDAIKSLSADTIAWLGTIQTSGLTLHENYLVARQQGYSGAFGHGEHLAWLAADPARQTAFNNAVIALANTPMLPTWATRIDHNRDRKAAGYRGVFICGGDTCFASGQCDDLGRRH